MEEEKEMLFNEIEGVEDPEANDFEAEVDEGGENDGECEDISEE